MKNPESTKAISLSEKLFTTFENFSEDDLQIGQAIFRNTFSLTQNNDQSIKLVITPSHIVKYKVHQMVPQSAVSINFDLKFQIIYAKQRDLSTDKIGFSLFTDYQKDKINFYTNNSQCLRLWLVYLSSKINQRGFHQSYQAVQKLGKGNFAAVYEAVRREDNKKFAVKAFSKMNSFTSKNGKESLAIQMSVLRKLNHKNLIHLEGIFQSDNSIYVVLEKLQGGSLLQKIQQKQGIFESHQVKKIMFGLMRGLQHLHAQRIMHRDLKPENILLRSKDSLDPVIVDFGLASFIDIPQYLFFRCGTPGYVAPQIINLKKSQHVQPECDIFSLGVMFHILLTGKPLFAGDCYEQIYLNNKNMVFDLSRKMYKKFDQKTMDLLQKMLIQDPSKRINAAKALNHDYFIDSQNQFKQQQTQSFIKLPLRNKNTMVQQKNEEQYC